MALPIHIPDLFTGTVVEWERLEFKAGWNDQAALHTLCAFANDLHNWGGGYLVFGVAEQNGQPILPPTGLEAGKIDAIQKDVLRVANRIVPAYHPVMEPHVVEGRNILVIWAPGGQNRPYKAPVSLAKDEKEYGYYVRVGSSTRRAKGALEAELLQLAATVPYDDRTRHDAELGDLSLRLILSHLQEIRSALFEVAGRLDFAQLCRQMQIVDGPPENLRPRNVGLLFFSESPQRFFPQATIDVVHFPGGKTAEFTEQTFSGPLEKQLRDALAFIRATFVTEHVLKRPDRAEADRFFTYPYPAIEEALANAVYHRGYDVREPIEVQVTPTEMIITSYPGPDPSVGIDALNRGGVSARRYRNRRIGEFLKELRLTEGRGTGVPTIFRAMLDNGSPEPRFETDEARSYFTITLPLHPLAVSEVQGTALDARTAGDPFSHLAAAQALRRDLRRVAILRLCLSPQSRTELMRAVGLRDAKHFRDAFLQPLVEAGLLTLTLPGSVHAPTQRYVTTPEGRLVLDQTRVVDPAES